MEEDDFTSTVDGARGFAQMMAKRESKYPDGYSPDYDYDDSEEEDDDGYDNCNCSDKGCPCNGFKTGRL